jgi:AAA domain
MRLTELTLKNYRCFENISIPLHPQLTVIVAENGQGKSTLLAAIRVGLWPFIGSFDLARAATFNDPQNSITIDDARLIKAPDGGMGRKLPAEISMTGDWGLGENRTWPRFRASESDKTKTKENSSTAELRQWARQLQTDIRDEPKGNNNWKGIILDPLHDIPTFPPLFEFLEDGNMAVSKACPTHLQKQAQASINLLRLSPTPDKDRPDPRLIRFRKAAITKLRQQIQAEVDGGMDFEAALAWFAEVNFPDSAAVTWPAFFSCIRWYPGDVAEQRLRAINYQG